MSDPKLDGFNDPEYQKNNAAFQSAKDRFTAVYDAKALEMALSGMLRWDQLPPELARVMEAARSAEQSIDWSKIPEEAAAFFALAKALLAVL